MRRFAALAMLFLIGGGVVSAPVDAADRIFGERFVGDGVRFRESGWGDDLYPVNINNNWGHINQRGDLIIFPRYDWSDYAYGGVARVVIDGRTGFINDTGEFVIDPIYTYADRFEEGSAIIGNGRKYGFINRFGVQSVPYDLDGALRFREGVAAILRSGRIGFINPAGKIEIPMHYARVRSFHEGLAMVEELSSRGRSGRRGYINRMGNFVFVDEHQEFEDLGNFGDGLAPAKVDGKWGFIDRNFILVVEPQFDTVRSFAGGLAAVRVGDKWGYIEKIKYKDEPVNDDDAASISSDTVAAASGATDAPVVTTTTGETIATEQETVEPPPLTEERPVWRMVIEPRYDEAFDFDEVLALVKVGREFGYIDREGKAVIAPQFTDAEPLFHDMARVEQSPNFGYIALDGTIVWDPRAPADGIFDLTNLAANRDAPRMNLPPRRRALRAPYPPDHLYDDVLPHPR